MIVEDNEDIREGVGDYLRTLGWEVLCAAHGREALKQLEELEVRPCLILLDLSMPVMDGPTFRRYQLQQDNFRDVPVCVISGESDIGEKARELGVDYFLAKPFNFKTLADTVRRAAKCPV